METIIIDINRNDSDNPEFDGALALTEMAPQYRHINGWGIDADPNNEPTYPMKRYTGDDHERLNYERPPQQPVTVEILHSNERPNISAVFGTVNPPSGLSGRIRRLAFRYSEESLKHWFALVLADRINMIEGIISDMKNDGMPNVFAEMGWGAEWKYNKKGVVKKLLITVAVTALLVMYLRRRNRK
jgi:hypothetical protein